MSLWGLYVVSDRREMNKSAGSTTSLFIIGWFRGLSMDDSARIEEKLRSIETSARQGQLGAEQVQFRWQRCAAKSMEAFDEECRASGDLLGVGEWVEYCRSVQHTLRRGAVNNANDSLDATWRRWRKAFPVRVEGMEYRTFFDPQGAEMFVGVTDPGDYYQPYESTPILYCHDQDYWSLVTLTMNRNDSSEWSATFDKVLDDLEAVRWFFSQGMDLPSGLEEIRRKVAINPFRFPLADAIPTIPGEGANYDGSPAKEGTPTIDGTEKSDGVGGDGVVALSGADAGKGPDVGCEANSGDESKLPLPPFDPQSNDWCVARDLALSIGLDPQTLQDYRKHAAIKDVDDHGEFGVDRVGAFRRKCLGNKVCYYLPRLNASVKYRLSHARSTGTTAETLDSGDANLASQELVDVTD